MEENTKTPSSGLGLLGLLGAAATYFALRQHRQLDPRAATYCAAGYEMLAHALVAIDACEFGKASIALREAERCADEGLNFAPEHTVTLPEDLAYSRDGSILIRHSEDRERFERFLETTQASYEAFLVSLPGASRCKACERRVGTGDPCVCAPCRQAAYEACAPEEAVRAHLFDRISATETLNAELAAAAKNWKDRADATLRSVKEKLGLSDKEAALVAERADKAPERE